MGQDCEKLSKRTAKGRERLSIDKRKGEVKEGRGGRTRENRAVTSTKTVPESGGM